MSDKREKAVSCETVPSIDILWSLDRSPHGSLHWVTQYELIVEVLA